MTKPASQEIAEKKSLRNSSGANGSDVVKSSRDQVTTSAPTLPKTFQRWFQEKKWQPRDHQTALISQVANQRSTLLIAPTGAGKTLAGFLPSLIDLSSGDRAPHTGAGLHTLYISPLKALTVDVQRNLLTPIEEMALPVRTETRTGDTPTSKRSRQRTSPPDILLTTPEQLALLHAHPDAPYLFADLRVVIVDELHALAGSKRGDLLCLDIARLRHFSPNISLIGLSATVARPTELRAYLMAQKQPSLKTRLADLVVTKGGAKADIEVLELNDQIPLSGHTARYAMPAIYEQIRRHRMSLIFVNTRMQAELVFQELWKNNEKNLRIALHHGSLEATRRRKVEAAMAKGNIDCVVATSTLDLGIDWGDVDLVINVGAPKGASRLIQRIGRANHRLDEPSKALLVPGNIFEVLECRAAIDAAQDGTNDVTLSRTGALDVLAQHIFATACMAPFDPNALFAEVRSCTPFTSLTRQSFDRIIDFVSTGGYALRAYDRFARLRPMDDGRLRLSHPKIAQIYRMNVGTIVDTPKIKIRLGRMKKPGVAMVARPRAGGRIIGEIDESFIEQLEPGDTFAFAGEVLRFEGLHETDAFVTKSSDPDPKIPSFLGGKFPLSTHLAERVRKMLSDEESWQRLPEQVSDWLKLQKDKSLTPNPDQVLVETFSHRKRHFLVAYPFEGRLAHQTLGMLLTRRLNRAGARPVGFVANDYGLAVWGLKNLSELVGAEKMSIDALFSEDMLGDDLDAWLAESSLMKRTFRNVAVISGLTERRHFGRKKSGRQLTVSTDLIFDVLRKHDSQHVLLEAAWADTAQGHLDLQRLGGFLHRIRGQIVHRPLAGLSPLSVPILLEIGKEPVTQGLQDDILKMAGEDIT